MAIQRNGPEAGSQYLDMPSMDPLRKNKFFRPEDEADQEQEPSADFPADAANDIGQLSGEQAGPAAYFLQDDDEGTYQNAAHDDIDADAFNDPNGDDLEESAAGSERSQYELLTQGELVSVDQALFDASVESRNPDTSVQSSQDNKGKRIQVGTDEDELSGEEKRVYNVSLDGPGTDDMRS